MTGDDYGQMVIIKIEFLSWLISLHEWGMMVLEMLMVVEVGAVA